MKPFLTAALLSVLLAGCEVYVGKPRPSTETGDLNIIVYTMENEKPVNIPNAEIYLDGKFIGTVPMSPEPGIMQPTYVCLPKCGEQVVRVTAPGYKPYEKTITVLGPQPPQQLNVCLEKQ